MTDHTEYIAGIRALADWLENNPTTPSPTDDRLLVPLMTNDAVAEFASGHDLDVVTDESGNTSVSVTFGPVTYHAYGYVDFAQHVAKNEERDARRWAEKQGMELREAERGEQPLTISQSTIDQAENLLALREAGELA